MKNRRISVSQIKQNLNLEHLCNNTIVARIKKGEEFTSGWQTKKPFINKKNRVKRFKWCRDHLSWTSDQWKRVIWTNESPFVLQYGNRERIWKKKGEPYNPECTRATVEHDKKIMVWGAFAAHGVGNLYRVEGIMDQHKYHYVLVHQLQPSITHLFPDGNYIFQQDNDPKHTAKKKEKIYTKGWYTYL